MLNMYCKLFSLILVSYHIWLTITNKNSFNKFIFICQILQFVKIILVTFKKAKDLKKKRIMTKNVWHFYYLNSKNWSFYTLHETNHSVKLSKIVVTFKPQMQFWCPSRFKLLCVALLKHQHNCCVLGSNLKKWDQHSWDLALFGKKTQQKGVVWNFTK